MDMKKPMKAQSLGLIPDLSNQNVVVGAKQLKKAVQHGTVQYVFLAQNADPGLTEPLAILCTDNHIPITWVADMADLGRACGIEVGAAAAAVLHP